MNRRARRNNAIAFGAIRALALAFLLLVIFVLLYIVVEGLSLIHI